MWPIMRARWWAPANASPWGLPHTSMWQEGAPVRGTDLEAGTVIATFIDGVYPSRPSGNHAAVYVSQDYGGILVWDQWLGQPVHQRVIRFKGGEGDPSNDGDAFSVVEV